jgi:hypothetical protein
MLARAAHAVLPIELINTARLSQRLRNESIGSCA